MVNQRGSKKQIQTLKRFLAGALHPHRMQLFTKLGHLPFDHSPQSCPHGQLYIDEATRGFGISLSI